MRYRLFLVIVGGVIAPLLLLSCTPEQAASPGTLALLNLIGFFLALAVALGADIPSGCIGGLCPLFGY